MAPPNFSTEDLVDYFRTYAPELQINKDILQHPTWDKVQEIYRWFVKRITGCRDVDLTQMSFTATDLLQFGELHSTSYQLVILCRAVVRILMDALGEGVVKNIFSISDLTGDTKASGKEQKGPDTKRMVRIFSYLVRLTKFVHTRKYIGDKFRQRMLDSNERRQKILTDNSSLKERIHKIRSAAAEKETDCIALRQQCERLSTESAKLASEKLSVDQRAASLDATYKAKQAQQTRLDEHRAKLVTEDARYAQQIIACPEQYKADVDSLKHERKLIERELEQQRACTTKFGEKLAQQPELVTILDALLVKLGDVKKQKESERPYRIEIQRLEHEAKRQEMKAGSDELLLTEKRDLLSAKENQYVKVKQQFAIQAVEKKREMDDLNVKLHDLSRHIAQDEAMGEDLEEEIESLSKEIGDGTNEHEMNMREGSATITLILERVDAFTVEQLRYREDQETRLEQMVQEAHDATKEKLGGMSLL